MGKKIPVTAKIKSSSQPTHYFRKSNITDDFLKIPPEYIQFPTPTWFTSNEKADISVIVPMHRSAVVIKDLIASWDLNNDGYKTEILFVEDHCPANSRNTVIEEWSKRKDELKKFVGRIFYSTEAGGFGAACNAGAFHASGEYLIFLNADTSIVNNWIRPMIRLLKKSEIGIVGNLQLKVNTFDEINSAGMEWSWETNSFLDIGREIYEGHALDNPILLSNCPKEIVAIRECDMVIGACFAIRKKLFEDVGGFNLNYRIGYWEDCDLCMKVKEKGYKVVFQPNSRIYHRSGHSKADRYFDQNKNFFLRKWVNSGRINKLVTRRKTTVNPKKILLKRHSSHGDVLIAAAVAPALKKQYPDCQITFRTMCPEVLRNNPYIDIVETTAKEDHFEVVYAMDLVYEQEPKTNILEAFADFAGVQKQDCKLFIKPEVVKELPENYAVIHSGKTKWVGREWSPTKFEIVANKLRKLGMPVVCIGLLGDHKINCDLDLRGKTTIAQLAYIIERSQIFIGIDSFPMHIAQALDTPGVCFFGSIDPKTRIISSKMHAVVADRLPCLGCHQRKPPPSFVTTSCETQLQDCINNVSIERFMQEITKVLNEKK